jgi:hypothetical protein
LPSSAACSVAAVVYTTQGAALIRRFVATATDVLRLAVALSDGEVSLAEPAKFRRLSRAERRLLLELLEECPNRVEDMLRFVEPWKRLGERLHPGEYRARFPQSVAAFDVVRNDLPFATFRNRVEGALKVKDVPGALTLLEARPGELARPTASQPRAAKRPGGEAARRRPRAPRDRVGGRSQAHIAAPRRGRGNSDRAVGRAGCRVATRPAT